MGKTIALIQFRRTRRKKHQTNTSIPLYVNLVFDSDRVSLMPISFKINLLLFSKIRFPRNPLAVLLIKI